MVASNNYY